ncbi:MAG TPA: hypothetical protein PKD10_15325 [Paracoccaceae bacterium]|nr:hypothetical protein [Paracoccaceae bacterium]
MRIVILSLEAEPPLALAPDLRDRPFRYQIDVIAAALRDFGHDVRFRDVADPFEPADAALLHVDLTVVPDAAMELAARYPVCLNRATRDIAKRAISRNLLSRGTDWPGEVMVKSDLNCAGLPEANLNRAAPADRTPLPFPKLPGMAAYRVLPSGAAVPPSGRDHPALVVEAFRPERDGADYALRCWNFAGPYDRCNRYLSARPVVKGSDMRIDGPCPVPDDLRAERMRLGFDYGKFDFALVEGKTVLYDANRTPSYLWSRPELMVEEAPAMARGLLAAIAAAAGIAPGAVAG